MSLQTEAWFELSECCDVSETALPNQKAAPLARLAAPHKSKARWVLAAALPVAAAAVAIAVLLPTSRASPTRPALSFPAARAAASSAPAQALDAAIDDEEDMLPAPRFVLDEPPAKRAIRPSRANRLLADAEQRPRIHLTPPSAGLDRQTAALNARAARYAQRQDWNRALLLYLRSTRLAPNDPAGWFGLALCQFELHRPRAADDAARTALLADPAHPMANLLVGFLAQEQGRYGEARYFYASYLSVDPSGPYAAELASVLEQMPVL